MAMYLPGSNFQADATQTLYLMNPGYSSTSNAGNMVLLSPSSTADVGQHNTLPNTDHQQQFNSFFLSPGLPHASMSHQSPLASTSINGNPLPPPSLFMVEVNNQAYNNQNGTRNELPFLSSSGDVSQTTQPLVASLSLVNGGQPSTSDMAQYSLRQQSLSAIQEHHSPSLSNGASLGWNMESSQGSNGPPGQGLSLSLSHQQHSLMQLRSFQMQPSESSMSNCVGMCELNGKDDSMRGERLPNRWTGSLSSFRASLRDGAIGNGLQNSLNGVGSGSQVHVEPSSSSAVAAPGSLVPCSKYLSAAQQLLDELLNVGRGLKISSNKHTRMQSLMATGFVGDVPFASDKALAETRNIDGVVSPTGMATSTTIPTATAILNTSVPDAGTENVPELTMPERQELQMKKAKLMAMLDEVVRRYRQYYNHIKVIVTSFESAAGVGTAKMYTALALQTISRNFCCLRDAISSQVQVASKALGEDSSGQRVGNGGSRLQFVDQRVQQQQRALQQLGMMQQHSWRPQRGLPERSVSVLRAWLFEHFLHPYPKDADKLMLARQTGLTRSQVSNWFINARVRLWKPMVEEMYLKESRGAGAGAEAEAMASQLRNVSNAGEEEEEEEEGEEGEEEGMGKGIVKQSESHVGVSEEKDESSRASNTMMMMMMMNRRNQSRSLTPSGRHVFHEKEHKEALMKKSRDGGGMMTAAYDDNRSNLGMDIDRKAEEKGRLSNEMRDEGRQSFAIPCEDGMLTQGGDGLGGEGSFNIHLGSMGRYPQEAFRYAGNRGVSLTLGLQNCDNNAPALPILPHQQHYVTNDQALPAQRRHGLGSEAEYYYAMHNETGGASSVGHSNEAIGFQNQERFAIQLLNDFVS